MSQLSQPNGISLTKDTGSTPRKDHNLVSEATTTHLFSRVSESAHTTATSESANVRHTTIASGLRHPHTTVASESVGVRHNTVTSESLKNSYPTHLDDVVHRSDLSNRLNLCIERRHVRHSFYRTRKRDVQLVAVVVAGRTTAVFVRRQNTEHP